MCGSLNLDGEGRVASYNLSTDFIHFDQRDAAAWSTRHKGRGAESRTWARGQLKYNGFPVVWTRKQTEKMPLQKGLQKKKKKLGDLQKKSLHRNFNGSFGRN